MQNQELLAKLTQARQAQARALQRFAQAQQRLAQLEARQRALHASTPYADQAASRSSTNDEASHAHFLPESGELELLADFAFQPQTDQEKTERIVTRPTEATQ